MEFMVDFNNPILISFIPIFISCIAIIISILGYFDNRKNINIVLIRENERQEIKDALIELKSTSDLLKNFPSQLNFHDTYFALANISNEVYEKDKLKLTIEFQNLDISTYKFDKKDNAVKSITFKYTPETINATKIREAIKNSYDTTHYKIGAFLEFNAYPNVIQNLSFDLGDIFHALSAIEENINTLNRFEYLIESFDAEILKNIDESYEQILTFLAEILQKKVYTLEFDRNIKPSQIEDKMNDILNYNKIFEKSRYLSTEIASRVDELRKELIKQSLL